MEMVVGASEATMKSLLNKLGGLLAHEYALIRGDIQYINDEMASMQAFLGDLSPPGPRPPDEGHDPTAGREVWCVFLSSTAYEIWTWRPRRSIAELRLRAQQIGERRTRYGGENPKTGSGSRPPTTSTPPLRSLAPRSPSELGKYLQRASSDAASQTAAPKQDQCVLSIVGFGGVGKTTIATKLYQKYGDQFDRRADIDAILQIILNQVKPQSKDDSEQQGSSGGGPSVKKRIMAAVGTAS